MADEPAAGTGGPPQPMDAVSDHSLVRRYRRGSQDAATQLYLRYARRLRGLARARIGAELAPLVDADDLVQSVFGSFFRRADSGDYDVPGGEELWKLFLVIALNKIRNQAAFHRAAKRDVRRRTAADATGAAEPEAGDTAEFTFLELAIDEALGRLPAVQREMVRLRVEGHEVAEIARRTRRAKRTVERLMQEAQATLRGLLGEGH